MNLDEETKVDLMEAFHDLHEEVEHSLIQLLQEPEEASIHRLFRAIHNVKGNAGILQLSSIVEFTHEVEEVAGALRRNLFKLTDPIAEVMLIAMDRLSDLHQVELFGKQFDYLRIDELKLLYHSLSIAQEEEADGIAMQILQFLGAGLVESGVDLFASEEKSKPVIVHTLAVSEGEGKVASDLTFFQEVAFQLDSQLSAWNGRTQQIFDWAMKMNNLSGSLVDENQLAAAVYLHDMGMSLLPRTIWSKKLDLKSKDELDVKKHPHWGYNYLVRIPGWEEAATIILQHHECVNGTGYPEGLTGADIHSGAKILSILDTFFFLTNGRIDSSLRRSTVRAVSAVNARVDTEFEGLWVQCFNHIIRSELKAGNI